MEVVTRTQSKKRRSYIWEFTLSLVSWCYQNGENVSKTSLCFIVDCKLVHCWIAQESLIRAMKTQKGCASKVFR